MNSGYNIAAITSLDAFQLPSLVADAVKAVDDLWVGIELQLVLNLLRIDQAIAQRAQLTVTRSSPQILLRFARKSPTRDSPTRLQP